MTPSQIRTEAILTRPRPNVHTDYIIGISVGFLRSNHNSSHLLDRGFYRIVGGAHPGPLLDFDRSPSSMAAILC